MKAGSYSEFVDFGCQKLEVEFDYSPPYRGARDSFMGKSGAGVQLEPDEDASIEISRIMLGGYDITELIHEDYVCEILKKIQDIGEDYDTF